MLIIKATGPLTAITMANRITKRVICSSILFSP
jgi:hypothetical protein